MIADAIKRLWAERGYSPELLTTDEGKAVVMENYRILCDAIDRGMADYMAGNADQGSERTGAIEREVSPELTAALRDNAFIFSGWKAVRTMEEAGLMMVDRDGGILPYEEFERRAGDVFRKQGLNLRAEYQHASQVAQMAAHWADIERDGDRYDLQYRTVGDDRVRPEHRDLDGVTLPPSDPFWQSYYPPNGWGCRCSAVQVRRGKYQSTLSSDEAIAIGDKYTEKKGNQIFRTNVGRSRKAFERSINYPPKGQCQGCDSNLNLKYNPRNANCQACAMLNVLRKRENIETMRNLTRHNVPCFYRYRDTVEKQLKRNPPIKFSSDNIYSGKICYEPKDVEKIMNHCFSMLEVEYAKRMSEILPLLKNGEYEELNENRPNYQKKIEEGMKYFVKYIVEIDNIKFTLKCYAKEDDDKSMIEYPYFFMANKKEEG